MAGSARPDRPAPKTGRRRLRRIAAVCIALVLFPFVAVGLLLAGLATDPGRAALAWTVNRLASSDTLSIEVAEIDGHPLSRLTVGRLAVGDADGVWLTATDATVDWSPAALLDRTLSLAEVSANRIDILRPPIAAEPSEPPPDPAPFTLPQARLIVDRLAVGTLALGEAVAGAEARLTVAGTADVALPGGPGNLSLDIERTDDSPGRLALSAALTPGTGDGLGDDRLSLSLVGSEPAGGVLAGLLNLPGTPAVRIEIAGAGPLRDFSATLDAEATNLARMEGTARIEGAIDRESLTADLALALTPGADLPPPVAELLGPNPALDLRVHRTADGDLLVERATVTAAVADFTAEGRIDPAGDIALDLSVDARSAPLSRLVPDVAWTDARLTASVGGEVSAPTLDADLALTGLQAPGGIAADRTVLTLSGTAGAAGGGRGTLALTVEGPAVPGVPPALLSRPLAVEASGGVDENGRATVDSLTVTGARIALEADATAADFGAGDLTASARLTVSDLAGLVGPVTGAATVTADISRTASDAPIAVTLQIDGERIALDPPAAAGIVGSSPRLTADLSLRPDGSVDLTAVEATFAGATASADGSVLPGALAVALRAELPDLAAVDPTLSGALSLDANLSGPMDALGATVTLTGRSVTAAGEPLADLSVVIQADQLPARPRVDLQVGATVRDSRLRVAAAAIQDADGTIRVTGLNADLPGATAVGTATLPSDGPPTGDFTLEIADLGGLTGLAGQAASGAGTLSVVLNETGEATLDGALTAIGLPAGPVSVGRLGLTGTVALPSPEAPAPVADLTLSAAGIDAAGQRVDSASLRLAGTPAAATLDLTAEGPLGALSTRTSLDLADPASPVALVERLSVAAFGEDFTLQGPARVAFADGTVTVDRVAIASGSGSLDAREIAVAPDRLAGRISLSVATESAARRFAPDLGLSGSLILDATLAGTPADPTVEAVATARDITARAIAEAGLPTISADARARLAGGTADLSIDLTAGNLADLTGTARLPVPPPADGTGRIEGTLAGTAGLAGLNALLAASGDRIDGRVTLDLAVAGSLAAPVASGTVSLADGSYRNLASGLDLRNVALELEGRDRTLTLTRLSATDPAGGTLSGSGRIDIDPDRGLPVTFALTTDRLTAVDRAEATAQLSGTLDLEGALLSGLALDGAIRIDRAEFRAPDRLPLSVPTLDVIELNTPPALAERRPQPPSSGGSGAPPIALNITVDAPNRVFLRGFGVDSELAGRLSVRGTAAEPRIGGFLQIVRGTLNFLGRSFTLDEGRLTFNEAVDPDPALSLAAVTPTPDGTATLGLVGTLTRPEIALSASPPLPEDEILSRLLFGESSGELSALQAVQLAQAVAAYAGLTDTINPISRARELIGLDYLDVDAEAEGGPTIEAEQVLTDRVRVGARQSVGGGTSATVELELLPELRVESEVGTDGSAGLGVIFQRDY